MTNLNTPEANITAVLRSTKTEFMDPEARSSAEILTERAKVIKEIAKRAAELARSTVTDGSAGDNIYNSDSLNVVTGDDIFDSAGLPLTPHCVLTLNEVLSDGSTLVTTVSYNGPDAPCSVHRRNTALDGETILADLAIDATSADLTNDRSGRYESMLEGSLATDGRIVRVEPAKTEAVFADAVSDVNVAISATNVNVDQVLSNLM